MESEFFFDDIPGNISVQKVCTSYSANTASFHLHNSFEIYLFLRGEVNYWVNQSFYQLQRGTLLIFNSQEIHRAVNTSESEYERLLIHFRPHIVKPYNTEYTDLLSCFLDREIGQGNAVLLHENQIEALLSLARRLNDAQHGEEFGSDVLTMSLLLEVLVFVGRLYRNGGSSIEQCPLSDTLQDVLRYIEENLAEDLSLDTLSEHSGLNKYHLNRLFKRETGSTLYSYILLKRISLAKQLLAAGNNVSETCSLAGFNDYANFIRAFKKTTGCSPSRYKTHFQR